jgi:membrane associated rhomboid family serine protease
MDLFHAFGNNDHVAHWAHIGGTVCGFFIGIALLKLGWVDRTEVDFPSILELGRKE